MILKTWLVASAIAVVLLCVGFQAVALFQTGSQPIAHATPSFPTFESSIGGPITPNGGGGDPVDGPGWPT